MNSSYKIRTDDACDIFAREIAANCDSKLADSRKITFKEYVKTLDDNMRKKYTGILDYSLDTNQIKRIFEGENNGITWKKDKNFGKNVYYNHALINVSFKKTYKEYNVMHYKSNDKCCANIYVKGGYFFSDKEAEEIIQSGSFIKYTKDNNEVIALITYKDFNGNGRAYSLSYEDIEKWKKLPQDRGARTYFRLVGEKYLCRIRESEKQSKYDGEYYIKNNGDKTIYISKKISKLFKKNPEEYAEKISTDKKTTVIFTDDGKDVVALMVNENDETSLKLSTEEKNKWSKLNKKARISSYFTLSEFNTIVKKANSIAISSWNYSGDSVDDADIKNGDKTDTCFLRKYFYHFGFFVDGVHYVRYKRSAGSSRDGQCLFICEEYANNSQLIKWCNAGLDSEKARRKDITGWEAYRALTLSGIMDDSRACDAGKEPELLSFKLKRNQILVIPDAISEYMEDMMVVGGEADKKNAHLIKGEATHHTGENTIWDGQALLDTSIFEDCGLGNHGMMLLRNRFFKTCAFNTNLGQWFEDNGINNIDELFGFIDTNDSNGKPTTLDDIKMVVTPSSIKYIKEWGYCQDSTKESRPRSKKLAYKVMNINAIRAWLGIITGCEFGVVKTDKPTGHMNGRLVSSNYQVLNTIDLSKDDVDCLLKQSFSYLDRIDKNPCFLKYYTEQMICSGASEDLLFEDDSVEDADEDNLEEDDSLRKLQNTRNYVIHELLSRNENVFYTELCNNFKKYIRDYFRTRIKMGRVLMNGTYATLFGNPYEMLAATLKRNVSETQDTLFTVSQNKEQGNKGTQSKDSEYNNGGYRFSINKSMSLVGNQIYNKRFLKNYPDGYKLLGARSPHITMGNLLVAENRHIEEIGKYFNLSDEIVCINSVHNNIMDRLNGCDFDSDTMLLTDNKLLLSKAKPLGVPVKSDEIKPQSVNYGEYDRQLGAKALARLDSDLSNDKIGEIVNKSQILNSLYWTYKSNGDIKKANDIYGDISALSVLSGMEIDRAKRQYAINGKYIDSSETIKDIYREKYKHIEKDYKPLEFLKFIKIKKKSMSFKDSITNLDDDSNNSSVKPKKKEFLAPMEFVYKSVDNNARSNQKRKAKDNLQVYSLRELGDFNKVEYDELNQVQRTDLDNVIGNCETARREYSRIGIVGKRSSGGVAGIKENIYKRANSLLVCISKNQKILFDSKRKKDNNKKVIDFIVCAFDEINSRDKNAEENNITARINENALFILASLIWRRDDFINRFYEQKGETLKIAEGAEYNESDDELSIYGYAHIKT